MSLGADNWYARSSGPLLVEVTHQQTTSTIALAGECDLAQQERFRSALREVIAALPECVVLDLGRLSFIDSSGLHVVMELSTWAERADVRLVICPGSRQVQGVFEMVGLTARLPFVSNGELGA
jgi:anti-anti-sigma factor